MTLLAINWSHAGIQIFYLILSLSILVILHEFGHYITARWFKCRVEKFYLFFNPWFSLVKKKVGDTEYGIGWLPLGGYVKISGMIDESMDKEAMQLPPQPYEFRSKPAWQRLIIMLGGIIVNVLLAFSIYVMVLFVWGQDKTPNASVVNGIWCVDSVMQKIGLQNGDKLIAVNGKQIQYFDDIPLTIILNVGHSMEVNRNGNNINISIPDSFASQLKAKKPFVLSRVPAIVGEFDKTDTSNAKRAGLQYWDKIVKIDSTPIEFMDNVSTYLNSKKNQQVTIIVDRNKQLVTLSAKADSDGKLGIPMLSGKQYDSLGVFKIVHTSYGFLSSIPAGYDMAVNTLGDYIQQLKLMVKPKTKFYTQIGGFKGIGSMFPTEWGDWEIFWRLTGFLSLVLAIMNLLPIPALDGGHALFTLIEMITGRKPSDKFLEYAQIVGMVFLLGLMLYANGNDWFGWGKSR